MLAAILSLRVGGGGGGATTYSRPTMRAVTHLKQLTYRAAGPLNSISLILFANEKAPTRGSVYRDVHARKMNSPVDFFITLHDCRAPPFYVRFPVCRRRRRNPPSAQPRPTLSHGFLFFFISRFTLFRLVPGRSLTFEHVPRGSRRPRVRANNTRKLHWDSFYFVFRFFFFPTV